jgi:hypothetical protein
MSNLARSNPAGMKDLIDAAKDDTGNLDALIASMGIKSTEKNE